MSGETSSELHCPRCNHALGSTSGLPADSSEALSVPVTCPECATTLPAGLLVLAGRGLEPDPWDFKALRRWWRRPAGKQLLVWFGHLILALLVVRLLGKSLAPYLLFAGAAVFGLLVKESWRLVSRWGQPKDAHAQVKFASEVQWLVRPGAIEIIDHREPVDSARVGEFGVCSNRVVPAAAIRGVYVQLSPAEDAAAGHDEPGELTIALEHWIPDSQGRWRGIDTTGIGVRVIGMAHLAPAHRRQAQLVHGFQLAERIFRHCTGEPIGLEGDRLTLRGHSEPVQRWPVPTLWARNVVLALGFVSLIACLLLPIGLREPLGVSSFAQMIGLWVGVTLIMALLMTFVLVMLHRQLIKGALRRELARCVWTVERGGIRVVQESRARPADAPEHRALVVPIDADSDVDVEFSDVAGLPRVILRNRQGVVLAAITPDTLPAADWTDVGRCVFSALQVPLPPA